MRSLCDHFCFSHGGFHLRRLAGASFPFERHWVTVWLEDAYGAHTLSATWFESWSRMDYVRDEDDRRTDGPYAVTCLN